MKTFSLLTAAVFLAFLSAFAETEPNNTLQQANVLAHNGNESGSLTGTDTEDWFVINLPQGGIFTLTVSKTGAGNGDLYLIDGEKTGNPQIANLYLPGGDSPNQGWPLTFALQGGKYYAKFKKNSDPVTYQVSASLALPSFAEDKEPNDSIQKSVNMPVTGMLSGTMHYYRAGYGKDMLDWYKVVVAQAGIFSMKIHKKGAGITTLYLRDENVSPGKSISDFYLHYGDSPVEGYSWSFPIMAGTYWILAEGGDGAVDYKIEYTLVDPPWTEDKEPNDSLKYALNFPLNDSVSGIVYYYKPGIGRDDVDWYIFHTPEYGKLTFLVSKKGIYGSMHLRDTTKELQAQAFPYTDGNGSIEKIVPAGTYYFGFRHSSNWLQYKARMIFTPKPSAEFSAMRTGNAIAFENAPSYGESWSWNFDDGTKSTAVNPFHEFAKPGDYDICLIAKNVVGSDTSCQRHIIPGIDRFSPTEGGNSGDVTVQVFGGGLDTSYTASIMQGTTIIATSASTLFAGKGSVLVRFDLRTKPEGIFDLKIEKSGGPSYLLPSGFKIVKGNKADPWVKISGRSRILFNTWSTFTVNYGNYGNIDAVMTPVYLAFSKNPGLNVDLSGLVLFNLDTTLTVNHSNDFFTDLDSIFGLPIPVRIFPIIIPSIPAGSVHSFSIRLKSDGDMDIFVWDETPWFQSPLDKEKDECISEVVGDYLEWGIPDLQPIDPIIDCFSSNYEKFLNYHRKELFSASKKYFQYSIKDRFNIAVRNSVRDLFIYCGVKNKIDAEKIEHWLIRYYTDIPYYTFRNSIKSAKMMTGNLSGCRDKFIPNSSNRIPVRTVTSIDPNEKSGPSGYGSENYVSAGKEVPYIIYFENKSSATAPAHTITILDQLDTTKFDLSSFSFSDIQIGDSAIWLSPGLKEFALDKKLDKQKVVARISGKLDKLTGRLEWKLRSLAPVTLDDIEDPDLGILPPNKLSPEGQGSVSFFVRLKNDPVHKGTVVNQASIVFDANPAIVTNQHLTTFDMVAPQSAVQSLTATTSSREFTVKWSGTDDGSGIGSYNIYVKKDNDPFNIWMAGTTQSSAVYKSPADGIFRFTSVAVDKTGNAEAFPDNPDASTNVVTAADVQGTGQELQVYPALSGKELKVSIACPGHFTFRIYSTDGRLRIEKQLAGNSVNAVETEALSRGLYLWQLVNDDATVKKSGKFVVTD